MTFAFSEFEIFKFGCSVSCKMLIDSEMRISSLADLLVCALANAKLIG